jgi:putative transposase
MSNHYHLLVRTPQPNLARGMRDLNGIYAQAFNRRYSRVGHLFQGRYRAVLVESDEHLLTALAYVVRNPVRAGMCASPREWRWSSQAAALGERPRGLLALEELLSCLAPTRVRARAIYLGLTEDDARDEAGRYDDRVIDGSEEFAGIHLTGVDRSPDVPSAHFHVPRPPLHALLAEDSVDAIARAPTRTDTRCRSSRGTSACMPRRSADA